jgi:hypothetical protein
MRIMKLTLAALALAGCSVQSELESDPSYWAPEKLSSEDGDASSAIDPPIEDCDVEPPFNPDLRVSAPDRVI